LHRVSHEHEGFGLKFGVQDLACPEILLTHLKRLCRPM
jgi:hypothetical protein